MAKYRMKFGKVVADVFYDQSKKPKRAIILGYGLLSSPERSDSAAVLGLVKAGFMVWCPHYIGTFASDGLCTFENAAGTIYQTANFIAGGKGVELRDNTDIKWKVDEIILAGASFGGSAVLVAGAKSKHVRKIIALAAPTDYRKQWKGRAINAYISRWKRGWANVWRSTEAHWERFANGYCDLDAMSYADRLKEKNIFLVHATGDAHVRISHSKELYSKLRSGGGSHKLLLLNGSQHLGIGDIIDSKIFPHVMRWLKA
jgi:pimeloyl-ACP methyl ester carboxylesterase